MCNIGFLRCKDWSSLSYL